GRPARLAVPHRRLGAGRRPETAVSVLLPSPPSTGERGSGNGLRGPAHEPSPSRIVLAQAMPPCLAGRGKAPRCCRPAALRGLLLAPAGQDPVRVAPCGEHSHEAMPLPVRPRRPAGGGVRRLRGTEI